MLYVLRGLLRRRLLDLVCCLRCYSLFSSSLIFALLSDWQSSPGIRLSVNALDQQCLHRPPLLLAPETTLYNTGDARGPSRLIPSFAKCHTSGSRRRRPRDANVYKNLLDTHGNAHILLLFNCLWTTLHRHAFFHGLLRRSDAGHRYLGSKPRL